MALTRRAALFGAGAAVGVIGTRWMGPANPSLDGGRIIPPEGGESTLNDASLLSEPPIFKHIAVRDPPGDAQIAALRAELKEAEAAGRPLNLSAARHSMGGQSIPRDGHAITFDTPLVTVEPGARTYAVQAGTRWHQVIAAQDPLGLSPKVMQSNADFGVASTFSVNAHGWLDRHAGPGHAAGRGPLGTGDPAARGVCCGLADGCFRGQFRPGQPDPAW